MLQNFFVNWFVLLSDLQEKVGVCDAPECTVDVRVATRVATLRLVESDADDECDCSVEFVVDGEYESDVASVLVLENEAIANDSDDVPSLEADGVGSGTIPIDKKNIRLPAPMFINRSPNSPLVRFV